MFTAESSMKFNCAGVQKFVGSQLEAKRTNEAYVVGVLEMNFSQELSHEMGTNFPVLMHSYEGNCSFVKKFLPLNDKL